MSKPRILVCGGRDFADRDRLISVLDKVCDDRGWNMEPTPDGNYLPDVVIISGKARGADTMAIDWAVVNWQEWEEYPADWNKYGKSAGYIRNKQMLDEGKPDLVVAFPGGRGTANMVKLAKDAGVAVLEV
jgi:hypothetical protein